MSDNKRTFDDLLADAHNLPETLPGDALGGGFENGEGPQPDDLSGDALGDDVENGEDIVPPKRSES
jgi:hypothetical protein